MLRQGKGTEEGAICSLEGVRYTEEVMSEVGLAEAGIPTSGEMAFQKGEQLQHRSRSAQGV